MSTMKPATPLHRAAVFAFALAYGLGTTNAALADDTEIFFPEQDIEDIGETIRPNLLFMIDTSGSMGQNPENDPGGVRMTRLKEGFRTVIRELNTNVNVGLGRYGFFAGGTILFPVAPIDEKVKNILFEELALSRPIAGGSDEAQQRKDTNAVALIGNNAIEFGRDSGSQDPKQRIGLRFNNVSIPQGVKLLSASVEFQSRSTTNNADLALTIQVEASDNAPTFAASSKNISDRTYTSDSVLWKMDPWTADQQVHSTPDLADLLNDVIGRSGWCGGNSIVVSFDHLEGDGYRYAYSYAQNDDRAPVLRLTYSSEDDALSTGCTVRSTSVQVNANNGDAEEGPQYRSSNRNRRQVVSRDDRLELGAPTDPGAQIVGFRFDGLAIPRNATITNARMVLTADAADSGSANFTFRVEDDDDADAFPNSDTVCSGNNSSAIPNCSYLLSVRSQDVLSPSVTWSTGSSGDNNLTSWSSGQSYTSPDLKALVQAVVSQSDWDSGNALAFFVTGTGQRRARAYDDSPGSAARLVVDFQTAGTGEGNQGFGDITVREYLEDLVDDLQANGSTPTVGALYESANYMRGDRAFFGRTRSMADSIGSEDDVSFDHSRRGQNQTGTNRAGAATSRISSKASLLYKDESTLGYVRPSGCSLSSYSSTDCRDERYTGTTIYKSPIAQSCATNSIILLSDGIPTAHRHANNNDEIITKIRNEYLGGGNCSENGEGGRDGTCGAELAAAILSQDNAPEANPFAGGQKVPGAQPIKTYTIAFGDKNATPFMDEIAKAGGTDATYFASSVNELVAAFRTITSDILNVSTTFVAPAVTVNTFNRLTNRDELYFALFRPTTKTRWEGNLKRYKLAGSPVEIRDAAGLAAVDPNTGFFKKSARSFWSANSDGDAVLKGGMVGRFTTTRKFYTYTGTATALDAGTGTTSSGAENLANTANRIVETNAAITKAMLGEAELTDTEVSEILQFSRGLDRKDDDGDGNRTEARQSFGDPLHSEPVLLTYGGTEAAPDITIFFGTNEGALHAVKAGSSETDVQGGTEEFAFVPQELLPNLQAYYFDRLSYVGRPYGVDGLISATVQNPNADISSTNKAFLYFGLRMGGRQYYALDVTDRSAPKLKFVIRGGGTGAYRELGQTWSRAVPAKIKFNGAVRNVIVFTGGYDVKQDTQDYPRQSPDTMGRAIYIADADTGQRLWWAGIDPDAGADNPNLAIPEMEYSVPASPKVINLDGDPAGIADRIYITDIAGQVFRFILNPSNSGASNLATVRRIANFGAATTADGRRFYTSPDVAIIRENVASPFLAVSLGSGHRGSPLNKATKDRFYVLRDPDVVVGNDSAFAVGNEEDELFDATDNAIASSNADTAKAAQIELNASKGFFINFVTSGGGLAGEKVLTESQTFNNSVLFATYQPEGRIAAQQCQASEGLSRFYLVSVADGRPVANLDGQGTDDALTTPDRYKELAQAGLPPDPTILFPGVDGTLPTEALVCIGPECFNPGLPIETSKTYWFKRR